MNLPQPVAAGIWVVLGLVLLALVVRGVMRLRARGADVLGELPERPASLGDPLSTPVVVTYVSSTLSGQWLERVGVHHLGDRARGSATVHDGGLVVERAGSEPLYIDRKRIQHARLTSGMAGKHTGSDAIVVVTWDAPAVAPGESVALDTGLHVRRTEDRERLLNEVNGIVTSAIDGEETS